MPATPEARLEAVINLCKRRGFVYPSGEIYGGTRSAWDYGPLGVELKENIKRQWWRSTVTGRDDVVGLDSSVILPRRSGRPRATSRRSSTRWWSASPATTGSGPTTSRRSTPSGRAARPTSLAEVRLPATAAPGAHGPSRGCSTACCKTFLGPVEDETGLHYLRPETAQGIFVNFVNVMNSSRKKPPFGIAQIGKSLPQRDHAGQLHLPDPGVRADGDGVLRRARHRRGMAPVLDRLPDGVVRRPRASAGRTSGSFEHPADKLSHYSKRTVDIEYRFGFPGSEWGELEGIANRTDFDLTTHTKHSGVDLSYFDPAKGERWTPFVIEPAAGLTRSLMTFLMEAYAEDEAPNTKGGMDKRTVLRLDPRLAPVKVAVLPLSRNEDLSPKARDLAAQLRGTGTWSSTTPARSGGATGGRTRSAPRSASPWTSTRSPTRP